MIAPCPKSIQGFGPQSVQKPKVGNSKANNSKMAEDGAITFCKLKVVQSLYLLHA